MSLPLRTRGVLAGLVTLAASPLIAVAVLGGATTHTVTRAAAVSPEVSTPDGGLTGRGLSGLDRAPLVAATPTASPTATTTPSPTPATAPHQQPTPKPRLATPVVKPAAKPAPPSSAPAPAGSIESIIRAAAARHGVSGDWMVAIARCESSLNPRAVNPNGHYGLFQFAYSTFYGNGGTNIWDPSQQSEITARMLSQGQAGQWSCA